MNPKHSPRNTPRIDCNPPANLERGPTAPRPGKYQSNAERYPEDYPQGPWPSAQITKAPIYCAVDNRDGHQCFKTPLSIDRKVSLAHFLRDLNYGQMEIGYPSSNDTEFNGVRELVSQGHVGTAIPQVLTLASINHIDRTLESIRGASAAIVHLYHTTARPFQERRQVGIADIIRKTTAAIKHLKARSHSFDGEIFLQVSAESFQDTPIVEASAFYRACIEAWKPTPEKPMIINIPNTVERDDPHEFASKVHNISNEIKKWGWREAVIISVHTHNDRGGAVQAARMSLMTGAADRVEGTEFGHGERNGNMSLSTFKGILYVDGVDPEVYIPTPEETRQYEEIMGVYRTQIERDVWKIKNPEQMICDRTPFVGPQTWVVNTGVHADTTYHDDEKMRKHPSAPARIVHLPADPRDFGFPGPRYQATSQQGVTGMAAAFEQECGIRIPEWMRREYYGPANGKAVEVGTALDASELFEVFTSTFVQPVGAFEVVRTSIAKDRGYGVSMSVRVNGADPVVVRGDGDSRQEAVIKAMRGVGVSIDHVNSITQYRGTGDSQRAVTCVEVTINGRKVSGAGLSTDKESAFIDAVISAVNRGSTESERRIAV
jgi:2-isopropylmalate synthase